MGPTMPNVKLRNLWNSGRIIRLSRGDESVMVLALFTVRQQQHQRNAATINQFALHKLPSLGGDRIVEKAAEEEEVIDATPQPLLSIAVKSFITTLLLSEYYAVKY